MKRCCVTGCARTTKRFWPGVMWICSRHWRLVPAPVKAEHRAAKRALRDLWRRFNREKRGNERQYAAVRCRELCAWLACIREARIADAMGVR